MEILEFKEKDLHREHRGIKTQILEDLVYRRISLKRKRPRENVYIYACYYTGSANQEEIYIRLAIELISTIINSVPCIEEEKFEVLFDEYGNKAFKGKFYGYIKETFYYKNLSLEHISSEKEYAIQAVDMVCGSIRRYLIKEDDSGFKIFTSNIQALKEVSKLD